MHELLTGERLRLFVNFVRELMCVNEEGMFDGDVRIVFMKSGLIDEGFVSSSTEQSEALRALRARGT